MSKGGDNPYWDDAEFQRAKASKADAAFVIGPRTNDATHYNWDHELSSKIIGIWSPFSRAWTPRFAWSCRRLSESDAYDMNATVINQVFPSPDTADCERDGRDWCDRRLRRAGWCFT